MFNVAGVAYTVDVRMLSGGQSGSQEHLRLLGVQISVPLLVMLFEITILKHKILQASVYPT